MVTCKIQLFIYSFVSLLPNIFDRRDSRKNPHRLDTVGHLETPREPTPCTLAFTRHAPRAASEQQMVAMATLESIVTFSYSGIVY